MSNQNNPTGHKILLSSTLLLIVAVLVAILYGPGLKYPFFFDDFNSLMNDQGIVSSQINNSIPHLESLGKHPLRPSRNLTWISFVANYKLSGMSPAGFRWVNLTLHSFCTILVYLLIALLWPKHSLLRPTNTNETVCWPALAGTMLFLCHPLALNTTLYISQRFGALATTFYLLGFYAWLKGRAKPQQPGPQWLWFIVAGAAFWAAMHSKEMAITLPLTILFYEIYAAPPETNTIRKKLTPIMLILLIPLMFLFFAWQIGLFNQTWINIGFRSKRLWSPSIHFLSESRAFFHYWKLLLIPLPESLSLHHEFQPSPDHLDLGALSAVFGHLALLIFAWKIRRKAPLAGFGIVWFYLVLGPPYLFLPQKELLVEYKTYLAAPGVAILTAGLLTAINDISERRNWLQIRYFIYAIVGGWIFCLTMITYQRQTIFQNPIMIWSDVLEKYPDSRRALNNRAVAWLKQKSPQKALTDLSTLVANHPEYARGFENRGRLRLYLKDYNGALADFDRTLTLLPNEPELQQTIREIEKLKELAQRTIGRPPENLE